MHQPYRTIFTAGAVALCLASAFAPASAQTAVQQPSAPQADDVTPRPLAAPAVSGVEVDADAGLAPGSTLRITLRGTPGGKAHAHVGGPGIDVPLPEGAPGVYSGQYTLRRTDRIAPSDVIRTTLAVGPRVVVSNRALPPSLQAQQQAATQPLRPLLPRPVQDELRIERFVVVPVDRLEPGTELRFAVDGPPDARVTFELPNIANSLPMREQQPGHYVGSYTLRRQDTLGTGPVVATLRAGERSVSAPLSNRLLLGAAPATAQMGAAPRPVPAAPVPLSLQVTSPAPGTAVDTVMVQGRTAPRADVRVAVDIVPPAAPGLMSVAQPVAQQTVQADAEGNFSFSLGPQRVQPGTRYEVLLNASQGTQVTPGLRLVLYQRG